MKTVTILSAFLLFHSFCLSAQSNLSNDLNAYQYVEIDPPTNGTADKNKITPEDLRLTKLMEQLLQEKGFLLTPRDESGKTPTYGGKIPMPLAIQKNRCVNLIWFWGFSPADPTNQTLKVRAVNCFDEIVFENTYRMNPRLTIDYGIRALLAPVLNSYHRYDDLLNYRKFIPRVDATTETEETLRQYFASTKITPLEGIYKSINDDGIDDPSDYKVGIKLHNGRYEMIVLETDNSIWRNGEVKGYFEKTPSSNLYPVNYYLSDKREAEGIAELSDIILTVSLTLKYQAYTNGTFVDSERKSELKYIKTYPNE